MNEQTGTAQPPGTIGSIAMCGDCELSTRIQVSSARNSRIVTAHLPQRTHTALSFLQLRKLEIKKRALAKFQMAVSHLLHDLKY